MVRLLVFLSKMRYRLARVTKTICQERGKHIGHGTNPEPSRNMSRLQHTPCLMIFQTGNDDPSKLAKYYMNSSPPWLGLMGFSILISKNEILKSPRVYGSAYGVIHACSCLHPQVTISAELGPASHDSSKTGSSASEWIWVRVRAKQDSLNQNKSAETQLNWVDAVDLFKPGFLSQLIQPIALNAPSIEKVLQSKLQEIFLWSVSCICVQMYLHKKYVSN